jgi:hypothetical protein
MDANDLAYAVSYWLTFERLCGRSNLFDESYLAYQISHIYRHHPGGSWCRSIVTHERLKLPAVRIRVANASASNTGFLVPEQQVLVCAYLLSERTLISPLLKL